jgi:hypothetical protein
MARVLTDRSETGSHPLPLATESLTAYRLVEDRVRGSLKICRHTRTIGDETTLLRHLRLGKERWQTGRSGKATRSSSCREVAVLGHCRRSPNGEVYGTSDGAFCGMTDGSSDVRRCSARREQHGSAPVGERLKGHLLAARR